MSRARKNVLQNPWVLIALMLLLAACGPVLAFTPERAVVQDLMTSNAGQIIPNSIQVLQVQPWLDGRLVLSAYQTQDANRKMDCVSLTQVVQRRTGWVPVSGGAGCQSGSTNTQPIDINGGGVSGGDRQPLKYYYGLVYDPNIATVEVSWDDGEVQSILVENGSYLLVRNGNPEALQVRALNAAQEVIFSFDMAEPAPGKQEP
ncbi:MAG: hypothetical protein P8X95_24190 [Anaerolineales bacterium]